MDTWTTVDRFQSELLKEEYRFTWEIQKFGEVIGLLTSGKDNESEGGDSLLEDEKMSFRIGSKIGYDTEWKVSMEHGGCYCGSFVLLTANHDPDALQVGSKNQKSYMATLEVEQATGFSPHSKKKITTFTTGSSASIGFPIFKLNDKRNLQTLKENNGCIKLYLKMKLTVTYNWTDDTIENIEQIEKQSLLTDISRLYSTTGTQPGMFCDVSIQVKGSTTSIGAHRVILAVRSPVFERMFQSGLTETTTGVVKINDLSKTAVEILLHFMYTGSLRKDWGDVLDEIIDGAEKYELTGLTRLVNQRMINLCTRDNAEDLLELVSTFSSLGKAKADIEKYLKR